MTKVTHMTVDAKGELDRRRIHLREISGDSDAPLETVGQDLRTARLRRGDDLASVSRALKIRKDHLEALEEDHLDALPGRTYAVGFVRSYAGYLGLDSAQCVERFKAEISGRPDEDHMAPSILDRDDTRKLPQGWRIIAGFIILMLGYGIYHLWSTSSRTAAIPVPAAPTQFAPTANNAASKAQQPAMASSDDPQAATDLPHATAAPAAATPPVQAPGAAMTPPPAPATVAVAPASQPLVPDPAGGQVYGKQWHDFRVVLRAHAETHIVVRGPDGTVYINRNLNPGDSYRAPNVPGLTLTTSNAGAIEVDLDGSAMGKAGGDLQTTGGLSLDPQAIEDRRDSGRTG